MTFHRTKNNRKPANAEKINKICTKRKKNFATRFRIRKKKRYLKMA